MGRGGQGEISLSEDGLVPVTLLCGFLGSGKTTLLKHILENKHSDEEFKCAVIVNDMAELNIDKALIDQTSLIQDDGAMVGMQNGCICCTLQTDLVEQIIGLTQKKRFNYILIEASGVSEPHEIAPLFEVEDHDHEDDEEHDHDHSKPQLGEVAKLDTCVTVIDSADFYNNLGSMKTHGECDVVGTIAELMMDQVEFANIVILNKGDLVTETQQSDIHEKVACLNPKAKLVSALHCKIDVMEILNTSLYKDQEDFWVTSTKQADAIEERAARGGGPEACTARFDIASFVYRARRPFHPVKLNENFLEPFFMDERGLLYADAVPSLDETKYRQKEKTEEEKQKEMEEKKGLEIERKRIQDEALEKQKKRNETMGELLRSKGFMWIASSHGVIGDWQQSGNVLRMEAEAAWMAEKRAQWEGTEEEEEAMKELTKPDGEEWEYGDRRQEIVFIGHGMKRDVIRKLLDDCLLNDEEMALGPEKWKETWDDVLGELDEEDGEEEGEEDEEDDEEGEDDEEEEDKNDEVKGTKRPVEEVTKETKRRRVKN